MTWLIFFFVKRYFFFFFFFLKSVIYSCINLLQIYPCRSGYQRTLIIFLGYVILSRHDLHLNKVPRASISDFLILKNVLET